VCVDWGFLESFPPGPLEGFGKSEDRQHRRGTALWIIHFCSNTTMALLQGILEPHHPLNWPSSSFRQLLILPKQNHRKKNQHQKHNTNHRQRDRQPRQILGRIRLSKHRRRNNPADGPSANLHCTGRRALRRPDNIILQIRDQESLVRLTPHDPDDCTGVFDSIDVTPDHHPEADDRQQCVAKDKRTPNVIMVREPAGNKLNDHGGTKRRGRQKLAFPHAVSKAPEDDADEVTHPVAGEGVAHVHEGQVPEFPVLHLFETFAEIDMVVLAVAAVCVQTAHDDGALGFRDEFCFVGEVDDEGEAHQAEADCHTTFENEDLRKGG